MTAQAADRDRFVRNISQMQRLGTVLQADSITLYKGSIGIHNGSGKIAVGADAAGARAAGVSVDRSISGASNTTVYPELEWGHEEWFVNDGGVTAAMVGKNCTILDDQTVSKSATTTNDVPLGIIVELETKNGVAGVWVRVGVFAEVTA